MIVSSDEIVFKVDKCKDNRAVILTNWNLKPQFRKVTFKRINLSVYWTAFLEFPLLSHLTVGDGISKIRYWALSEDTEYLLDTFILLF